MPSIRRFASVVAYVALSAGFVGFTSDPTVPIDREPSVHAVLGANLTDTVDVQSLQALVAEVRGNDSQLAVGAIVRFQAQPPADSTRRI